MSKTLLVYVEDDSMSRDVMSMMVDTTLDNCELILFADSQNFLQKINDLPRQPDVIMLDIHIEPLDGFEMLSLLREQNQYHDTKIIALTASVMNEEVKRLRSVGFDAIIGKPIDQMQFPDLIARILKGEHIWHIR